MGVVNFGIPLEEANHLRSVLGLKVAVEGGTYQGGTAKKLSNYFDKVYTIEKSEAMIEIAKKNLVGIENVSILDGDTRSNLPNLLSKEDNILFWLDSHWSGGETYGEQDECPLIEELELIFNSNLGKCVILIDDARLFMAPPPEPHDERVWPSIADITSVLPDSWDLIIWNDVIFVTPKAIEFRKYMQKKTTSEWIRCGQGKDPGFRNCLRGLVRFFIRK